MVQSQELTIGLFRQGHFMNFCGSGYERKTYVVRKGFRFHAVFDVDKRCLRIQDTFLEVDADLNARYFMVIGCRGWKQENKTTSDREFTMKHSDEIIKFIGFSIQQNGRKCNQSKK